MLRQDIENRGAIRRKHLIKASAREALANLPTNTSSKYTPAVKTPQKKRQRESPVPVTTAEDEVFIDAKELFSFVGTKPLLSIDPTRSRSTSTTTVTNRENTIKPIRSFSLSTYITNGNMSIATKKPAVKRTLLHRAHRNPVSYDLYIEDLFYTDYLMETIKYFLIIEWKYVLRPSFLKADPDILKNRKIVLNCVQQFQKYVSSESDLFFTTVRLYDYLLANKEVTVNLHYLAAVTIMWILKKFDFSATIGASKVLKYSKCQHTREELLKMELRILKYLNFDILIPNPVIFVCYYLKLLQVENGQKVLVTLASFILESFTLHSKFSLVPPSFQAAAATHLSLRTFFANFSHWDTLKHYPGYYPYRDFQCLRILMAEAVKNQQNPQFKYREAYLKYATKEFSYVSMIYGDKVASLSH